MELENLHFIGREIYVGHCGVGHTDYHAENVHTIRFKKITQGSRDFVIPDCRIQFKALNTEGENLLTYRHNLALRITISSCRVSWCTRLLGCIQRPHSSGLCPMELSTSIEISSRISLG